MSDKEIVPPRTEDEIDVNRMNNWFDDACDKINDVYARVSESQSDSTATDVAGLRSDLNGLLAKLRTAGLLDT